MNFESSVARRRQVTVEACDQIGFDRLPNRLRHDKRAEHKDGLLWIGKVATGISRFIEVDQVHRSFPSTCFNPNEQTM